MSAPSEHTGNCIGFTLDKSSYNPVKGLWKGLQWCKVCCENQVRISPLPTRIPGGKNQIFCSYILCSNLSAPCYHFCCCSHRVTKDKAAPKLLWAFSLSHVSHRGAALITTDIHEDDNMCEQATYNQKTSQTALPSVAQTGMGKKCPLENWQLHTSHYTEKGNKPLHIITLTYTKGRWISQ